MHLSKGVDKVSRETCLTFDKCQKKTFVFFTSYKPNCCLEELPGKGNSVFLQIVSSKMQRTSCKRLRLQEAFAIVLVHTFQVVLSCVADVAYGQEVGKQQMYKH